ncbi:MAG: hypothetical protein ACON3Z_03890 [Bradymonadia bacterium]
MINRLATLIVWCTVLSGGIALAAGGGEAKTGWDAWSTNVYHLINLVILLGLLVKFAGPSVTNGLKGRAARVSQEIDEAAALHAEAKKMLATYNEKLAGFEAERVSLMDDYRKMGEAERDRIVEAAQAEAARLKAEARRVADNELARAKSKLEAEIVDRAVAQAEDAIRKQLTADDHRKLVADYFTQLESGARIAQ